MQQSQIDPLQFFAHTLQLITIVIGIGVGIVSVMSFLGYRNINSQKEKLEKDVSDLRRDLRADTQRLQDQVETRILRIDGLLDKFQGESQEKLKLLEEKGGSIQKIIVEAEALESNVRQASDRVEKLIAEVENKLQAQTEIIISKLSGGGRIDEQEREILATRETEIEAKEAEQRTAKDWLALGAAKYSDDDYSGALKYFERAVAAGLSEEEEIQTRNHLGTCYRYLGDYARALEQFKRGYELAHAKRKVSSMIMALNGMSKMQALLGNLDEALKLNSRAIVFLDSGSQFAHPWALYYNRALLLALTGIEGNSKDFESMLEKLQGFALTPAWSDLIERDAIEYDLASHPKLVELFRFCNALQTPRKKIPSVLSGL